MGLVLFPRCQVEDRNGKPIPSARANFYAPGTSTPVNTYTTPDLTTPHSNPVVADAKGTFPAIFTDSDYKIHLTDELGNEIYTEDDLRPISFGGTSSDDLINMIASTPVYYGAVGNGALNEYAAVQQAIDNSTGTIDLLGKIYKCDSPITLPSDRRLINGSLDFRGCAVSPCLSMVGTVDPSVSFSTGAIGPGANTLTFSSTAGYAVGDWLHLSSGDSWAASTATGEFVRVKEVTSGTVLTLDGPLQGLYSTSPVAKKLVPVTNTSIEDVRIIGNYVGPQRGLECLYSIGINLRNVTVTGFYTAGMRFTGVINSTVRDCTVTDTKNGNGFVLEACQGLDLENCRVQYALSAGFKLGEGTIGVNRRNTLHSCKSDGAGVVGFWFNAGSQSCTLSACHVNGNTSLTTEKGIIDNGTDNKIERNSVKNVSGVGIEINAKKTFSQTFVGGLFDHNMISVTDNHIEGIYQSSSGIALGTTSASLPIRGGRISRNIIESVAGRGIDIDIDHNVNNFQIDDNRIMDCTTGDGIYITVATGAQFHRVSISRNIIAGIATSYSCIKILPADVGGASQVRVCGNIVNGGTDSFDIEKTTRLLLNGNTVHGYAGNGLDLTSCNNVTVGLNEIDGGQKCIRLNTCDGVTIADNGLSDSQQGIEATACASLLVDHNRFLTFTSYPIVTFTTTTLTIRANYFDSPGTPTSTLFSLSGCTFLDISENILKQKGILINAAASATTLKVSNNTLYSGIVELSGSTVDSVIVGGNELTSGSFSVSVGTVQSIHVNGNHIYAANGVANHPLKLSVSTTCMRMNVTANDLVFNSADAGDYAMSIEGGGTVYRLWVFGNFLNGGEYNISKTLATLGVVGVAVAAANFLGNPTTRIDGTFTYDDESNTVSLASGANNLPNIYP